MTAPTSGNRWLFPVSQDVTAEVRIGGGRVTAQHIATLRAHLAILEKTLADSPAAAPIEPERLEPATPGDIVQLRPSSDPVFGGLLLRVTQTRQNGLAGYLLVPHRGGCRDAWQKLKHCEYERVGRVHWPESEWGFRSADRGRRARLWTD